MSDKDEIVKNIFIKFKRIIEIKNSPLVRGEEKILIKFLFQISSKNITDVSVWVLAIICHIISEPRIIDSSEKL
jgi:hypothetical protein